MKFNEDGFLTPHVDERLCVDCSACVRVCPRQPHETVPHPTLSFYLGQNRNADIVRRSSSGGVFYALAASVLKQGGIVFGAAWVDDGVRHIGVESVEELEALLGSKYTQSHLGTTYAQVRKHLQTGRPVLFSGTPCQVAALKRYLGRLAESDSLLCVDIACHGMPSRLLLNRYLREKEREHPGKVRSVSFRDKTYGWRRYSLKVRFDSGELRPEPVDRSSYMAAYLSDLALNQACYSCDFGENSFESDLTLADAWGVSRMRHPFTHTHGGLSVLASHTLRGEKVLAGSGLALRRISRAEAMLINERLISHHTPRPLRRTQYMAELRDNPRAQSLAELNSRYIQGSQYNVDVAILGLWMGSNYGAVLTAYALYEVVRNMGYEAVLADHFFCWPFNDRASGFKRFLYDRGVCTMPVPTLRSAGRLASMVKTMLVGSDQVWNSGCCYEHFFFLDWAKAHHRKIAYACSTGNNVSKYQGRFLDKARRYLQRFDAVSVREKQLIETVRSLFGVDASWQLDPVFLLDKDYWNHIAKENGEEIPERYLLAYVLDPSSAMLENIQNLAIERELSHVLLVCDVNSAVPDIHTKKGITIHHQVAPPINLWLKIFSRADFVVTDSFHGTCFSIIFERQFMSLANVGRGIDRFTSLMEQFGLQGRLTAMDAPLVAPSEEINYQPAVVHLARLKEQSLRWLEQALCSDSRSEELEKLNQEVEQSLPPTRPVAGEIKRWLLRYFPEVGETKRFLKRIVARLRRHQ